MLFLLKCSRSKNIGLDDVRKMVIETLKPAVEGAEELAVILHDRTQGNPLFVRALLSFLYESKLIWLDKDRNCWQWTLDRNGGADLPENVAELIMRKLRLLDRDSRDLFSLAACLGNRFDLATMGIVSGRDPSECRALLFSDLARTLLLPMYEGDCDSPGGNHQDHTECAFLHDSVQQAAYTLIGTDDLPKIQLGIGRLLLESLNLEQLDLRLFEVVNGLNAGFNLIQDHNEQVKVSALNLRAARKAYTSAAYRSALQFYRSADRFVEKSGSSDLP